MWNSQLSYRLKTIHIMLPYETLLCCSETVFHIVDLSTCSAREQLNLSYYVLFLNVCCLLFDKQSWTPRHDRARLQRLTRRGATMIHLPHTRIHSHVTGFPLNTNWLLCYIIIAAADCLNKPHARCSSEYTDSPCPPCMYRACSLHQQGSILTLYSQKRQCSVHVWRRPIVKKKKSQFINLMKTSL